jgi:outer membrane protein, heavy metal efflux system
VQLSLIEECMKTRCVAVLGAALVVSLPTFSVADEELTLEVALERAKQCSTALIAARRRVREAEARVRSRPSLRDNPEIEAVWGSRRHARTNDFEVGLSQNFELGGRGRARRTSEEAALSKEIADADETERTVLRDVRTAYLRGLHAVERLRLARSVESDAGELFRIAQRRHAAGDIAVLEVNVAASGLARARAEAKAAEAARASAHGDLRALLDIVPSEPLSLAGGLADDRSYDGPRLVAEVDQHPRIRVLEGQLREAEADVQLGQALAWPEITPGLRYERDQGSQVLWAGLRVTLPVFDRGQQVRATGEMRVNRLRGEVEAAKRVLRNQVNTGLALHELRLAAVTELTANAGRLTENEALARRSYEVGQIGLAELLLLRRETVEARREWLDSLLELAQARAELDSLIGGAR